MNVGEWSTRWAERYPHEPCIKCGDLAFTKGEFNIRVNRLAHALQEAGVKKGDRVAVLLANTHVYLEILQALCKLGGVMVPLNFRLAAPELEFILNDSEPVMRVYSPGVPAPCGGNPGKGPEREAVHLRTGGRRRERQ